MANYSALIKVINNQIKANGNQEITGPVLNAVLQAIVSGMSEGALFAGIADTTTNPPAYDGDVFYIAVEPGTYVNFGNAQVKAGIAVLSNKSGNWAKTQITTIDSELSETSTNPVENRVITENIKNITYYNLSFGKETKLYDSFEEAIVNVPLSQRKFGMIISFTNTSFKTEIYIHRIGGVGNPENFTTKANWDKIANVPSNYPNIDTLIDDIIDKAGYIYGSQINLIQGSVDSSVSVGDEIKFTDVDTRVRTVMKTPIRIETKEGYNVRSAFLLDNEMKYLKAEDVVNNSTRIFTEDDGYYVVFIINKVSDTESISPNEDIIKKSYQGNEFDFLLKNNVIQDINYSSFEPFSIYPDGSELNAIQAGTQRLRKYIKVSNASKFGVYDLSGMAIFVFQYDKNCELIRIEDNFLTSAKKEIDIDKECKYIRYYVTKYSGTLTGVEAKGIRVYISGNDFLKIEEGVKYPYRNKIIKVMFSYKEVKNGGKSLYDDNVDTAQKLSDKYLFSHGIIKLPTNYTDDGDPVRLIIFAHGSGNPTPQNNFGADYYNQYVDYLVKEGYAVADCWSWGSDTGYFKSGAGIQFWGTPTNYAVYTAFYNDLMDKFNLKKDGVFLFGKSQGGLQVYGIPNCTPIPVIARCSFAGVTNPFDNVFGYDDSDRFACFEDFGFTGLEKNESGEYIGEAKCMYKKDADDYEWTAERKAYIKKNLDSIYGYVPMFCKEIGVSIDKYVEDYIGIKSLTLEEWKSLSPCNTNQPPTIFMDASDDGSLYDANIMMQVSCRNGGNVFQVITMPSGYADPHQATDYLCPKINVVTQFGETVADVPIAWAQMLDFFRHYE